MFIRVDATAALPGSAPLDALRQQAGRDPQAQVKEAARQFEALLMQELLKTMRSGSLGADWLENSATQMGRELLDGQFAQQMSGQPRGLSELIARQLEQQLGTSALSADATQALAAMPLRPSRPSAQAEKTPPATGPANPAIERAQDFVRQHQQAARIAQAETGIPATFIIGQAAHETGWGRHEIRHADGSPSHNLFGIKAGGSWQGKVARVTTTEYIDGKAHKQVASFRAYDSYEDAFRDYAALIKNSPRYADVMEKGKTVHGFAQGLQSAGYATDPAYAAKLGRVINMALQLQRAQTG